ncbi:hypothetical protein Tco_0435574 [Tanacetum coccineum]
MNFQTKFIEADLKVKSLETKLQKQFMRDRDKIRALEQERDALQLKSSEQTKKILELQNAQSVLKCKMNADEDKYLDDILNLEPKVKTNENVVIKISQSVQALFMLGPKPLSFYDPKLKHGLGYENPYTLKKAIAHNPKLYDASCINNLKNTSTPKSIFFTSKEDILLTDFCSKEVKLILIELHSYFKIIQKWFPEEIKTMMNVFESMESDIDATKKQNEILNDQLLEATLKYEVKKYVLMCSDFVIDNSNDEIKKVKRESIDVQENLLKRIKILKNDFQRCQKQCIEFEFQLKHQKEKTKCENYLKKLCENSWISKMEKLENENVSLGFQVQSLIKECKNVKLEYQKLFDSIKKTRTQTQGEIHELIEHVNQKTYAYADVRAQNQDL